jgi:two-component system chemotaxis response regulator CheB
MADQNLRVLVVDDTIVYRRILSSIIEELPGTSLAATAPNGKIALAKMETTEVDLVLLDVEMPVLDGLKTLEVIRERFPDVGVIMVSGANTSAAGITIRALEHGAIDFVSKPEGGDPEESQRLLTQHIKRLVQLFQTRRALRTGRRLASDRPPAGGRAPERSAPVTPAPVTPSPVLRATPERYAGKRPTRIELVVIGVSTGGPNALKELVPHLKADINVPVLIVQHMPPLFTASLAESLGRKSAIPVREAQEGEAILPNTVLIAPGGKHMVIRQDPVNREGYVVALNENPPEQNCRPSVNVLFRSASTYFGGKILAVVMTGMGEDGCEGVRAMKRQGCICLTQEESTCVVYGMPRAVDEAGLSDARVPIEQMAERIHQIVRNPGQFP